MKPTLRRLTALAFGALALVSCGTDQPTAVSRPDLSAPDVPSASLLTTITSLLTVDGLQRTTPLAAPITVSKSIGVDGGTLAIPQAGVTVVVPKGALAQPTTITMTARAGSLLAYDFSPTGTTFYKPLVFNQSLRGTNVTLLQVPLLRLGYYSDPGLLGAVTATVSDLLVGVTNLLDWSFTAPIKHFSGYIVTCGRVADFGE